MEDLISKSASFDWLAHRKYLQRSRFRPLHDKEFGKFFREELSDCFILSEDIKPQFLTTFDRWVTGSQLNRISGLEAFPYKDFINGVTHSLDDLHVTYGKKLVGIEKEYAYHRRMHADFPLKTPEQLAPGDILVFAAPFAWYGALHPQTHQILDRCRDLGIPVHIDSAYFGCLRDFNFNYDHPAIQSVSFSLSKGLGMGSHRVGVRYSRTRHVGPVSIINDFSMELPALMRAGIKVMERFGSDYLQNRYGSAYNVVCESLHLRKTNTIHVAFHEEPHGEWIPVGIRSFLRYLVDDHDEFK